jgi:mannose-6-phosphate isomerase-like protein (cupin superfamily)
LATETELKQIRPIKYERPAVLDQPKVTVSLVGSELLRVGVQVVQPKGGETNMHAHPALDSTWLVLRGKAKFYGYGDSLIGEAGPNEGVFIPKGVPYWFEASSDEPLEILHITARDPNARNERVDYAPPAERQARRERGTGGRVATDEEREVASA